MRVCRTLNPPRRGAQMVEVAIVLPVVMLLTLGMISTAMGIFYYQQVATLAREGARFASVHGGQYYSDAVSAAVAAGNQASSALNYAPSDIYTAAIAPMVVGLDTSKLTYTVQWGTAATANGSWSWTNWVSSSSSLAASYNPNSTPPGEPLYNSVQVKVTYQWTPDSYTNIIGPLTLTSTSVMPMSY